MNTKDIKKSYLYRGITAFLVIAASILFFFLVYRFDSVANIIKKVLSVFAPIIFGLVIAYLLNPIVDLFNLKLFPKWRKGKTDITPAFNMIAVCLSLLIFVLVIAGIVVLIIPSLVSSVSDVIEIIPEKIDAIINWGEHVLKSNKTVKNAFEKALVYEKEWLKTDFAEYANKVAGYFASGVFSVINFIKNFVIGFLIAIYILYNKKRFGNKSRKLLAAVCKEKTFKRILFGLQKSNAVFSGFIFAKLVDSLIIGLFCFFGCLIMGIPYTMLVAVIIGVTNVIPVFGPYIGAIPCAMLILITSPIKGLYFIIFIILLQTFDGNVLGPKILGDKTGLETFWVIFAIIVGGGLFGIIGMIIGVPLFAIIYYFASVTLNDVLKRKNLSVDSDDYSSDKFYDTVKEKSEDA